LDVDLISRIDDASGVIELALIPIDWDRATGEKKDTRIKLKRAVSPLVDFIGSCINN
jgi:hypothetical protein